MSDLLSGDARAGRGAWRNIPEVIRSTVASLIEELQRQRDQQEDLRKTVDDRPSFGHLSEACGSKVGLQELRTTAASVRADANRRYDSVASAMASMAEDNRQLQSRVRALEQSVQSQGEELITLRAQMENKADSSSLQHYATAEQLAHKVDAIDLQSHLAGKVGRDEVDSALHRKVDASELEEIARLLHEKADKTEVVQYTEETIQRLTQEVRSLRAQLDELRPTVHSLQEDMASVPDRESIGEALRKRVTVASLEARVSKSVSAAVQESEGKWRQGLREVASAMSRKASKAEMARQLEQKVDREELRLQLGHKADTSTVAEALRRKADQADVAALRVAVAEGAGQWSAAGSAGDAGWADAVARVEARLAEKADADHVASLADIVHRCANKDALQRLEQRVEEVDAQARRVHDTVDGQANALQVAEDATRQVEAVRDLVESVDKQMRAIPPLSTGRWIWRSRELTESSTVPWDVQAVNTAPESLLWRQESTNITAVKPGLYRVALGFFASRPPSLTILVNGSPVFSTDPASAAAGSVVLHRHPAGSVGGISVVQFVALPARAALSVVYDGEARGQGFLELRKM